MDEACGMHIVSDSRPLREASLPTSVLQRYAAKWRFQVNNTKSEIVIYDKPGQYAGMN